MKYNFVIAGGSGFYKTAYSDLERLENVRYFENYIDGLQSSFLKIAARINFNLKLNKYLKTPLKRFVFSRIYPFKFTEDNPLCFIFFGTQFAVINTSFIEFLRHKYPTAKIILFMQDIVSSLPYYDIGNYKKRFDLVLSYDKQDCARYGLLYFSTPFSFINPANFMKREVSDVYFCGSAKSRYHEILKVYSQCKSKGLSCRFFITGVPIDDRIESNEITYDKRISYIDNLSYVYSSRCILEIMQKNAIGYTPRLWEALIYNKHLLSDNADIINSEFYNDKSIHALEDIENILGWIYSDVNTSEVAIKKKSPLKLLEFISHNL